MGCLAGGQVGLEAIIAVGLLCLLFLVMLFVYVQNDEYTSDVTERLAEANICKRVSSAVTRAYANPGIDINIGVARDVNINSGEIIVGGYFCDYIGMVQDTLLSAGKINVKRAGDYVVVQNV